MPTKMYAIAENSVKFRLEGELDAKILVELTHGEARALDALAGYGFDSFIQVFYKEMGKTYLQPYEKDLKSLFEKVRHEVPRMTHRIETAHQVFVGQKIAMNPPPKGKRWVLTDERINDANN
ncbi:hypothetical protein [Caulobacter phage Cr30]|uniref:hypothetical protein n=1 Tax=Caulobacter phage Cr30 TaxID=1357714 RepID=UPI0004A9BB60|nr:hypothetical protein OZ74_gp094 [Caulobacter phage Cr30]AGS80979.1 hypothetical protein [Caulobacter phage Cr30]